MSWRQWWPHDDKKENAVGWAAEKVPEFQTQEGAPFPEFLNFWSQTNPRWGNAKICL